MTDETYIELMAALHIRIDERSLAEARAELRRHAEGGSTTDSSVVAPAEQEPTRTPSRLTEV